MVLKIRDWHCEKCDKTQELLLDDSETPSCCDQLMNKTMMVMRRWNIEVDKLIDYKRAEKKGERVRSMVNRQLDPNNYTRAKR